jgi:hypothetical protein
MSMCAFTLRITFQQLSPQNNTNRNVKKEKFIIEWKVTVPFFLLHGVKVKNYCKIKWNSLSLWLHAGVWEWLKLGLYALICHTWAKMSLLHNWWIILLEISFNNFIDFSNFIPEKLAWQNWFMKFFCDICLTHKTKYCRKSFLGIRKANWSLTKVYNINNKTK